jgi:adhesin transport system outer membrane protein
MGLSACVATAQDDPQLSGAALAPAHAEAKPEVKVSRSPVAINARFSELQTFFDLPSSFSLAETVVLPSVTVFPGEMSMSDAARLSVTDGMDVRIAATRVSSQTAAARASALSLGPQISLQGDLSKDLFNSETTTGNLSQTGDLTLNLSRPLLNLPRQKEVERRFNDAGNAALDLENARSLAILAAADAYLSVLQSQLIITYAEEYEQRLQALATVMEQRVAAGGSSGAELERVRGRIQGIRATISDVRAGLSTSLSDLVLLTGQQPQAIRLPLDIRFSIPTTSTEAFAVASEQNWEVRAATGALRTNELRLQEVELRRKPTMDATLSQGVGVDWTDGKSSSSNTSVGVSMNWTLYRSGMLREELAEATAEIAEAQARRTKALQTLQGNLQRSYVVLGAVAEQLAAYRQQVDSNEAVVLAFTEQIRATNRPVLDVLEAYQTLFQSKIDLTNLLVTETQINLQVLHLLGELSVDQIVRRP